MCDGVILLVLQLLGCVFLLSSVSPTVNVNPTVNSGDLVIVENSTDTVVTTFTDWQYVYLQYSTAGFGITIYDVRACDNADCTSYNIQLIDENGCPTVHSGVGTIIPSGFVRDPVLSHVYETQSFQMFRWDNGNNMYFKGKKTVCEADTAACSDKCADFTSGRRRRDTATSPPYIPPRGSYVVTGADGKPCNITFSGGIGEAAMDFEVTEHSPQAEWNSINGAFGQSDIAAHQIDGYSIHDEMKSDYEYYRKCETEDQRLSFWISLLAMLTTISTMTAMALTFQIQTLKKRQAVEKI